MPAWSAGRRPRKATSRRSAWTEQFLREVRTEVVVGVFRADRHSPARVFYAHKEFACEAAALAISELVLQPNRGFPMLIDLADLASAGNTFDAGSFLGVQSTTPTPPRASRPVSWASARTRS